MYGEPAKSDGSRMIQKKTFPQSPLPSWHIRICCSSIRRQHYAGYSSFFLLSNFGGLRIHFTKKKVYFLKHEPPILNDFFGAGLSWMGTSENEWHTICLHLCLSFHMTFSPLRHTSPHRQRHSRIDGEGTLYSLTPPP